MSFEGPDPERDEDRYYPDDPVKSWRAADVRGLAPAFCDRIVASHDEIPDRLLFKLAATPEPTALELRLNRVYLDDVDEAA